MKQLNRTLILLLFLSSGIGSQAQISADSIYSKVIEQLEGKIESHWMVSLHDCQYGVTLDSYEQHAYAKVMIVRYGELLQIQEGNKMVVVNEHTQQMLLTLGSQGTGLEMTQRLAEIESGHWQLGLSGHEIFGKMSGEENIQIVIGYNKITFRLHYIRLIRVSESEQMDLTDPNCIELKFREIDPLEAPYRMSDFILEQEDTYIPTKPYLNYEFESIF